MSMEEWRKEKAERDAERINCLSKFSVGIVKNELGEWVLPPKLYNYDVMSSGCWQWRTKSDHPAYRPSVSFVGYTEPVARWILHGVHGRPLQSGECALHRCDNPRCINPDHLYIGTYSENSSDFWARKKQYEQKDRPNRRHENGWKLPFGIEAKAESWLQHTFHNNGNEANEAYILIKELLAEIRKIKGEEEVMEWMAKRSE